MKQNERRASPRIEGLSFHQHANRGSSTQQADVRVVIHISDVLDPQASPGPEPRPIRRPSRDLRRRGWGVEQPEASYPFRVESDAPLPGASTAGETGRAVLALAAGLTLAVLSYALFRGARGAVPVTESTAVLAPVAPSDPQAIEPVIDAPAVVLGVAAPSSRRVQRRRDERLGARVEERAVPGPPDLGDSRDDTAAIDAPPPSPAPIDVGERVAASEPTEPDATPPAAVIDPGTADEDRIRAALTRWQTAYSALDARAAREVWPSVDTRALERAFQTLKSQDVRFERCELTVSGGSARAACTGRATYVPRVGRQSPHTTSREWTFELQKTDERWTIASARGS
jgi:hypothetical protein